MRKQLAVTMIMLLAACGGGDAPEADVPAAAQPADTTPTPLTDLQFARELQINFANMTATPSGIYVQDLTTGRGAVAEPGKHVTVEYRAWLPDGMLFEERPNKAGFGPSAFMMGVAPPVPGLTEGMAGMRVGGVRRIVIPQEQGYGLVGRPEGVPERSPLVFEVKLVKVTES